jgi:hypothetical protein
MRTLRRQIARSMVHVHRISFALARYHASRMDEAELLFRFQQYAGLGLPLPLALALRESSQPRLVAGETEGRRILPQDAIAVRSPSGGGGGGVDVCPDAGNQVCSGGCRVPGM